MKKFTLLFSFTVLATIAFRQVTFAQAQRLILVEEFTQASCPPCADQNPAFNALLSDNIGKVISVKIHTSWPGFDPMYNHNTVESEARVDYYGISGVPTGVVDGDFIVNDCNGYDGAPACLSQSDIDDAYAVSSPLTISVDHYLSADLDSIYATITITALADVTGDMKARVAVTEKDVQFASPPGTNGETEFPDVMKKMLPDANGTALPSSITNGWTTTINLSWALANVYDFGQLAVVAWVQDDNDQSVLQAGVSEPKPLNIDGAVTGVSSPSILCTTTITPSIDIKNPGLTTLTSADVQYKLDNGSYQTTSWSGSLPTGSTQSFTLPAITTTPGSHQITANLLNINGQADPNPGNNAITENFGVFGTPSETPVIEAFTSATFPPADWLINNIDQAATWIRVSNVGGYQTGLGSAKYDFFNIPQGVDELFIKSLDLSTSTSPTLTFDIAKCYLTAYSGFYNDQLQIAVSNDCGATWSVLYDKDDANGLSTFESDAFVAWKPNASNQWRTDNVDLSSFAGNDNVIVKFIAISGYGNNLFIDNINVTGTVGIENVGENEISIHPNPANAEAVVHVNGILPNQTMLEVVNVLGQVIYSIQAKSNSDHIINTSNFETGLYIYRLNDNGKIMAQDKFNVSH